MGTLTARLLTLGSTVTDTANYTIGTPPPASTALLGMCPVSSTSVADLKAIWQRFPKVNTVRFFSGGTFVPWGSTLWAAIPTSIKRIAYSTKTRESNDAINSYWNSMPERFRGIIEWIIDHEPEQDPGGSDPTVAEFKAEYQQIGQLRLAHPRKADWNFGPTFTEYRANLDGETWWNNYGIVGTYPGVNRVGYDIYDTGYEQEFPNSYRTPQHMFGGLFTYRARVNQTATDGVLRTANVDEWGIARDADADPIASQGDDAAAAMAAHWNYFKTQPGAGTLNWFDRGGCYLGASPTDPSGRPLEYQAFASMAAAL